MKSEIERHMLPRSTALGMTVTAALTIMVAATATAQAGLLNFFGVRQDGVNGGRITIYPGPPTPYVTSFQTNNSSFITESFGTIPPLVGNTIDACCNNPGSPGGTLVVWMTNTGNLASNVPI